MKFSQVYILAAYVFVNVKVNAINCTNISTLNDLGIPSSYLNATGSITVPGFEGYQHPDVNPSTWTISTGIYRDNTSFLNRSNVYQPFWLDTNPSQDLSSPDLNFTGCAISFQLKDAPRASNTSKNFGCSGVLSDACYKFLNQTAKSAASSLAMTMEKINPNSTNSTQRNDCLSITQTLLRKTDSNPCPDFLGAQDTNLIFGDPSAISLADPNVTTPGCAHNIGQGSSQSGWFFQGTLATGAGNDLDGYYGKLKSSSVVMIVGWRSRWDGPTKFADWSDTRLFCLSPTDITLGSLSASTASSPVRGKFIGAIACAIATGMLVVLF